MATKVNLRFFKKSLSIPEPKQSKEEVSLTNVDNDSKTSSLYKERLSYKQQVNDQNLPVGNTNKLNQNLNNQLDTWYKNPKYAKYDNRGRLIRLNATDDQFSEFESGFRLLNFVADAAQEFFRQYNVVRKPHPKSVLNNISITKAYEPEQSYNSYFNLLYDQFFNEVLDQIKHTNKIKNIDDFINLFYSWFTDKNVPITEAGFYESGQYSLYNTGLMFDFYNISSEEDKQTVLNDVRWATLNYVAKVNGLRIDPNYPGRLIADIRSEKLITQYAKKYFPDVADGDIPQKILETYFTPLNFQQSSQTTILNLLTSFSRVYNIFIENYPTYSDYTAQSDLKQLYKKEFSTNKIQREPASDFTEQRSDDNLTLTKSAIETYVKFRLSESNIFLTEGAKNNLVKTMTELVSIGNSKDFFNSTNFEQRLFTDAQAINYFESFLKTQIAKDAQSNSAFVFQWSRGKEKVLTGTEEFANLVEQDEEGNIFSVSPVDISTDFS